MRTRTLAIVLFIIAGLTFGCGAPVKKSTAAPSTDAAVQAFLQKAKPHVDKVNQEFSQESDLVVQMSMKKTSYASFKSAYDKSQRALKDEVNAISALPADPSAKAFKDQYVALLNRGVQLMADEEQAMRSDGTMDPSKASHIKDELQTFTKQFQDLQSKYAAKK